MTMFQKGEGKQGFDKEAAKYVYVLIRSDLTLSQQGVQAVHASMAAIHSHGGLTNDTRLALLTVKDELELLKIEQKCQLNFVAYEKFWEPDHMIGWSALATAPISREQGRIFKNLKLWKPENQSENV